MGTSIPARVPASHYGYQHPNTGTSISVWVAASQYEYEHPSMGTSIPIWVPASHYGYQHPNMSVSIPVLAQVHASQYKCVHPNVRVSIPVCYQHPSMGIFLSYLRTSFYGNLHPDMEICILVWQPASQYRYVHPGMCIPASWYEHVNLSIRICIAVQEPASWCKYLHPSMGSSISAPGRCCTWPSCLPDGPSPYPPPPWGPLCPERIPHIGPIHPECGLPRTTSHGRDALWGLAVPGAAVRPWSGAGKIPFLH